MKAKEEEPVMPYEALITDISLSNCVLPVSEAEVRFLLIFFVTEFIYV